MKSWMIARKYGCKACGTTWRAAISNTQKKDDIPDCPLCRGLGHIIEEKRVAVT